MSARTSTSFATSVSSGWLNHTLRSIRPPLSLHPDAAPPSTFITLTPSTSYGSQPHGYTKRMRRCPIAEI